MYAPTMARSSQSEPAVKLLNQARISVFNQANVVICRMTASENDEM